MSKDDQKLFDLSRLSRYDLYERPGKVNFEELGKAGSEKMTMADFFDRLPKFLAAKDILDIAQKIASAKKNGRPVHLSMGAHVLKVGLTPLIIDFLKRKIITGISINGAVLIHDYEIAAAGKTSEDVDSVITDGSFGMAEQTGKDLASFIHFGAKDGLGLAESVGRGIADGNYKYSDISLLANAWELGVPVTAHPALGTDIAHLWPDLDWKALGETARVDFLMFCKLVENFKGAVYLNVGSAVVLPEVFLKAVSATRNTGADHSGLTTADFDFIRQYRSQTNVVRRPTAKIGKGFSITGHHEIMIPLLFAAVLNCLEKT